MIMIGRARLRQYVIDLEEWEAVWFHAFNFAFSDTPL
jgi:hypothetical protein